MIGFLFILFIVFCAYFGGIFHGLALAGYVLERKKEEGES